MSAQKSIKQKLSTLSNSHIVNKNMVVIFVFITGLFGCTTVDRVVDAHVVAADRILDLAEGK